MVEGRSDRDIRWAIVPNDERPSTRSKYGAMVEALAMGGTIRLESSDPAHVLFGLRQLLGRTRGMHLRQRKQLDGSYIIWTKESDE